MRLCGYSSRAPAACAVGGAGNQRFSTRTRRNGTSNNLHFVYVVWSLTLARARSAYKSTKIAPHAWPWGSVAHNGLGGWLARSLDWLSGKEESVKLLASAGV
jgi:hypothetical protein